MPSLTRTAKMQSALASGNDASVLRARALRATEQLDRYLSIPNREGTPSGPSRYVWLFCLWAHVLHGL